MHLHKWGKWSECTQACAEAVQWRRCDVCGLIAQRSVTTIVGGADAKIINEAVALTGGKGQR